MSFSKKHLLVGLIILTGSVISFGLSWTGYRLTLEHQNRLASQQLFALQQSISQILYNKLALTTSLEAFVNAHHYLDLNNAADRLTYKKQFELFTQSILNNEKGILSLQIAPQAIVSFLTEEQRNQKAIGHDLLKDERRRPQILDLIKRHGKQISGPLTLIQGGDALIMRKAVYSKIHGFEAQSYIDAGRASAGAPWLEDIDQDFWGLVTVLIDYQAFLQEITIREDADYEFAIKGRHGLGHAGEVFFGDAAIFEDFIQTVAINFDGGQWLVAVRAKKLPPRWPFVMLAGFGLMIFSLLAYVIIRLEQESLKAHQTSEALAQSNRTLADKSASQNKLFAIIGHELRTPAASLKMLFDKQQARQAMIYEDSINTQLDHLLAVIDDMSVVSDPERAIKGRKKIASVQQTLRDLILLQDRLLLENELKIKFDADQQSALSCEFNVQLFRQIAMNLIKNSLLHGHASQMHIQVSSLLEADQLSFKVIFTDNGCGINPAFHDSLFEAFERDASSDGTGLGLYISRKFAREALHGDLVFDRLYASGSRFILIMKLPLASEQPPSQVIQTSALKDRQIVYAEDNHLMREMTQEQLELAGAKVLSFENGQLALTYLTLHKDTIDLLLTDAFMPKLDGFDLIKQARNIGFKQTIIALTAASVGDEGVRLLDCGADHVLYKPLEIDTLSMLLGPLCSTAADALSVSGEATQASEKAVFDFDRLMANYNYDENIYKKFVTMFADNTPQLIQTMREGLETEDFKAIRHAAHQLKGNAATIYAAPLTEHMMQLMSLAEEQQIDKLAAAIEQVEQLSRKLQQALQDKLSADSAS